MRVVLLTLALLLAPAARAEEDTSCLRAVASRYIGETEKNLGRTLRAAEHSDAALLFDEADALFGRRTEPKDAHDRYASLGTSSVLQLRERYGAPATLEDFPRRAAILGFARRRSEGVIVVETGTGAQSMEVRGVDRETAIAIARTWAAVCIR